MVANPKEVLKEFADQSSIHGLHYISDTSRHWTERVFWFVCCALSWYGSYSLMMNSWEAFQTNAISFVVETTALEFQTSFPAISICETDNNNNVQKLATKIYGDHRDYNLDEIVREIAYFKGMCYYIKEFCLTGQYYCPTANFRELALSMRSTCEEVFLNCTWSGVRNFNCCKHFIPTETELGICYTLTMANESPDSDDYINMYSNRLTGPSDIYIKLSAASQVYIHSSVDVPYYNTIATDILHAVPGIYKQYKITIKDIANEDEVQFVGVHQRKCRFPWENYLSVSNTYSYSSCIVHCRRQKQMEMCNCTSHLMPNSKESEHCDIRGLMCLNQYYAELSVLKKKNSARVGLECHCVPSCVETEVDVITVETFTMSDNESIIQLMLDQLPQERLKRNVIRGRLDILVSLGGSVALFVGASILSFLEIIYYFFLRMRNVRIESSLTKMSKKL
ncbi:sodium channel protein Nach-like isoform X1 [Daktulosphaira vitifoliae]|uniref:sodium channel protein Nach-like isoform X1 n=1 Tax=Daktulosphaira vitifoliae TaxID=58002 RepID=UPI0021A9A170|nr:sodium channel protein Nach-like isoform X1 [Daktulosphaira vitifoliae]